MAEQKQEILSVIDIFPYGAPELRRAYNKYLGWGAGVAIGLYALSLGGWVAAQNMGDDDAVPTVKMRIITDVAELGPPPSIAGSPPPAVSVTVPTVKPNFGIPVPVPDFQITEEIPEFATQEEIKQIEAPVSSGGDGGSGDSLVVAPGALQFEEEAEPEPDAFVPVEVQPEPIKQVTPKYPDLAREAGIDGKVFVKVLVDKDGKVKKAMVVKGPEIFHEAALEAAKGWVFKPAIQGNKPVPVWVSLPFVFSLE